MTVAWIRRNYFTYWVVLESTQNKVADGGSPFFGESDCQWNRVYLPAWVHLLTKDQTSDFCFLRQASLDMKTAHCHRLILANQPPSNVSLNIPFHKTQLFAFFLLLLPSLLLCRKKFGSIPSSAWRERGTSRWGGGNFSLIGQPDRRARSPSFGTFRDR